MTARRPVSLCDCMTKSLRSQEDMHVYIVFRTIWPVLQMTALGQTCDTMQLAGQCRMAFAQR